MPSSSSRMVVMALFALPAMLLASSAEAGGRARRRCCAPRYCCPPPCVSVSQPSVSEPKFIHRTAALAPAQHAYVNQGASIDWDWTTPLSPGTNVAVVNFIMGGAAVATFTDNTPMFDAGTRTLTVDGTVGQLASFSAGTADVTVTVTHTSPPVFVYNPVPPKPIILHP